MEGKRALSASYKTEYKQSVWEPCLKHYQGKVAFGFTDPAGGGGGAPGLKPCVLICLEWQTILFPVMFGRLRSTTLTSDVPYSRTHQGEWYRLSLAVWRWHKWVLWFCFYGSVHWDLATHRFHKRKLTCAGLHLDHILDLHNRLIQQSDANTCNIIAPSK